MGLTFEQQVVRLHEELTRPRLAHFVGHTSTHDVAIFSQLRAEEPGDLQGPGFQILQVARGRDSAFASTKGVYDNENIVWGPQFTAMYVDGTEVVVPHSPVDMPLVNSQRLAPSETPPVPVHPLPYTQEGLVDLLLSQGAVALG